MTESTAVATIDARGLLTLAIERGATPDSLERLVALAERVASNQARAAWHEAMAKFQRACPAIRKTARASITSRRAGGRGYTYAYAPLDEIADAVRPHLGEVGLSYSWRYRVEPPLVFTSCRVTHVFGHWEESGEIPMPIGGADDGSGANAAQRVGIALTYGRRYTLLAILGISPEDDDDAANTPDTAPAWVPRDPEGEEEGGAPAGPEGGPAPPREVPVKRVVSVNERHTGRGGQLVRYEVAFDDGTRESTIDAGIGRAAILARDSGAPVVIGVEMNARGFRDLVRLVPAGADPEADEEVPF